MKMRSLCISLVALLFITLFPANVGVEAANNYHYLDEKGTKRYIASSSVTVVSQSSETWHSGWYIVKDKIDIKDRSILIEGDVHLILADKASLNVNGSDENLAALQFLGTTDSLTIYAQSTEEDFRGQLTLIGGYYGEGIGYGKSVDPNHPPSCKVTINGGHVIAEGGPYAAGIGGGWGVVTINGGYVEASGGNYAAGIGGSNGVSGGTIIINGGRIVAAGGDFGAGIGGGSRGHAGNITINGGTILAKAKEGYYGPGIGGHSQAVDGGLITINGGHITAISSINYYGIGGYDPAINISGGNIFCMGNGIYCRAIGPYFPGAQGKVWIEPGKGRTVKIDKGADIPSSQEWKTISYPDKEHYTEKDLYFEQRVWEGWNKEDIDWYYYQNGVPVRGWVKVDGKRYYLASSDGAMQTGWLKVDGKWYYLAANGAMQTGWVKVDGKWYYLAANGAMQTGWVKVDGNWYYLAANGAMQTGWVKVEGKWYYLAANGTMQTGWVKVEGKWYYFYSNGRMARNTTIDGHYLGSDGAWQP